jgi:hypothetical protein
MSRKVVAAGVVIGVLALVVGLSLAQPPAGGAQGQGGQNQGRRGQGDMGPGRFDMAQMRQRRMERMKEQLGVDDQAWKVMEPRLTKVMELNLQVAGNPGRMFFGGIRGTRGGPGGQQGDRQGDRFRPPGMENRELTAVEKAEQQLQTTLENQSAAPETIKAQLTAVRNEREKARQELATAQQQLREILTVKQEAQLVLMGQLN